MTIPSRPLTAVIALLSGAGAIALMTVLLKPDPSAAEAGINAAKILLDYLPSPPFVYPLTIQNLMWLAFFLTFGELLRRYLLLRTQEWELHTHYLPEDDQAVIGGGDLAGLFRKLRESPEGGLGGLIKRLVLQFQASQSVDQTHTMLNSQLEMRALQLDVQYSMIRYLIWLIPTLGFLGTVIGIALALNFAGSANPDDPKFMLELTSRLGVAFFTTLVALAMSAILMLLMHLTESREESLLARSGQYCLDHFINRLYVEK